MNFVRYQGWAGRPVAAELGQVLAARGQAGQDTQAPGWTPRVDVVEQADRFVIHADLPGVDLEAIEVQMDRNVLSIRGERAAPSLDDAARLTRQERRHGAFERSFTLPETADADGIAATARHGVLEVVIPKRAEASPRRIQVGSIQ